MYRIKRSERVGQDIRRFIIEAPHIARKRKCGQFVIVRLEDGGERIPLTIVDSDLQLGTITLIVQGVGKTTKQMNLLQTGDSILDLVGPLGQPTHVENFGTAITVGGGVGNAIAYPTAVALKEAGNHVISIAGARSKDHVILEAEYSKIADEVYITTDDGSYGTKGLVTHPLQQLLSQRSDIGAVFAIGPIVMMKAVCELTKPFGVKTIVSLNPVMVDGTGMCGGCRAVVDNRTVFVCVDGPEFDGHLVDFDLLERRNRAYRPLEQTALENYSCKTLSEGKSDHGRITAKRADEDSAPEDARTRRAASVQ